jgi:hypothetical protein
LETSLKSFFEIHKFPQLLPKSNSGVCLRSDGIDPCEFDDDLPCTHIRQELAMTWNKVAVIVICALVLALLSVPGGARANLITNGGFETTANVTPPNYPAGPPYFGAPGIPGSGGVGQVDYNTTVTGWSNPLVDFTNGTGYNFIFAPSTASSTGSNGYNGGIALYGPGNGFNNGLTASPNGGQFLGGDGDTRYNGPIQQTISGLVPGQSYTLGFYWALAQQSGAGGTPTAQWIVSLGSDTQSTPNVQLPSAGSFVPWMYQTFTYTASSSSEVLSFLASEGGPFGGPPFLLLDGVTLNVPEPSSVVLLSIGLFGIGAFRQLRKRAGPATV